MRAPRTGRLASLAVACLLTLAAAPPAADDARYGAIVDAGSTGSRAAIFAWRRSPDGDPEVRPVAALEDRRLDGRRPCPVTDLARPGTDTCGCLVALVDGVRVLAVRALGDPAPPTIPLWLKATAGARREAPSVQAAILDATDRCLAGRPGYDWRGAEVISGAREGLYAWLAVNALARTLDAATVDATLGIVEIGGQSAQIAYRVSGPTSPPPPAGEILTVALASRDVHVFAASDLLGKNAALHRLGEAGARACAADADPARCARERIDPFVCSKAPRGRHCGGRPATLFPPRAMRFVGLSNVMYAVRNLGLGDDATLRDVQERADRLCGPGPARRERRRAVLDAVDPQYRAGVCFDALYATRLAGFAWDVPLEHVRPPDPRWADDASWPLGAMLVEALRAAARTMGVGRP
jgi:hypothetical protein